MKEKLDMLLILMGAVKELIITFLGVDPDKAVTIEGHSLVIRLHHTYKVTAKLTGFQFEQSTDISHYDLPADKILEHVSTKNEEGKKGTLESFQDTWGIVLQGNHITFVCETAVKDADDLCKQWQDFYVECRGFWIERDKELKEIPATFFVDEEYRNEVFDHSQRGESN